MFLQNFRQEIAQELTRILQFWADHALDEKQGGFIGKMDFEGHIHASAEKGGVLNARILWTFSAAYNFTNDAAYLQLAKRAYDYLINYFLDKQCGGIYWSVDAQGNPLAKRKQIYCQAFAIYGLAEYYKATQHSEALDLAKQLFAYIEQHSFDTETGGYWEAFSENWTQLDDWRLSEKDRNDPKTMNTHLHILEAYACLYEVWQDPHLAQQLRHLLTIFTDKILDKNGKHLLLFFDKNWQSQSAGISFGHDIEAAWLLQWAAQVVNDETLLAQFKQLALAIAYQTQSQIQADGSLYHEFDPISRHYDTHREWWVEAEAMVGFLNAYQNQQDHTFLDTIQGLWHFTKKHLLDTQRGEWVWGVYDDYTPMTTEDRIGFWKCPYHNTRACIELLKRVDLLLVN